MSLQTVSVIIRTLNEERYLRSLLEGISSQSCNFNVEVVLIDSGSTDQTLNIASEFNCNILFIDRKDFSFGRSLNLACASAVGDYLVLVSGHCFPVDNYWINRLVSPLSDGIAQYVYGGQIAGDHSCWSEHNILKKYFPSISRIPQNGFFCNNANSAD